MTTRSIQAQIKSAIIEHSVQHEGHPGWWVSNEWVLKLCMHFYRRGILQGRVANR